MLERPLGELLHEPPEALREPPRDRVREPHRALESRPADELDRVAHDRVRGRLAPRELVPGEPERGEHGRVELRDRPPAELADPVVDRANALHRPVREALGEGAVARVEPRRRRGERAVGVRAVLEHAPDDAERGLPGRGGHRTPRRNSS